MRSRLEVIFAAMCFGTTGTAQKLGPDNSSPLGIATMRTIIGAALLYALSWYLGRDARDKITRPTSVRPYTWVCAAAGMALFAGVFFAAVRETGISIAHGAGK